MKNILWIIGLLTGLQMMAQSQDKNYIVSKVYKQPSTQVVDTLVTIQYFDGLGRPMQNVALKAGGTGKDIITPFVYDRYGREEKKYLPYVDPGTNSMVYRENDSLVQTQYGNGQISGAYLSDYLGDLSPNAPNPFSQTKYENSPLNRVIEQGAPGESWRISNNSNLNHTVKFNYTTNKSKELHLFKVAFAQENNSDNYTATSLEYAGWYPANQLYVTITRDENWQGDESEPNALIKNGVTKEYKDKEGHVILKRSYNRDEQRNTIEQLDTYYVYDDYGNLAYVIPPLASSQILRSIFGRPSTSRNFPWTQLSEVDEKLAEKYEHSLEEYKNEEILNVDLADQYGGTGGFTINVNEDGDIALAINISTTSPMPLKNGIIVDLKEFGDFEDRELGRITGDDYEYLFLIKQNAIVVSGKGKVPYISTSLEGASLLDYEGVFPFTTLVDMDDKEKKDYEAKFYNAIKAGETNPEIENSLNAQGKITVSLTQNNILSVAINLTAKDSISFKSGSSFRLPFERKIEDISLGQYQGYELRVSNNNLVIEGTRNFINFNFITSTPFTRNLSLNTRVSENGLCYIYHYDKRNRLIEKFIPDNGWTYMVYDKLDRLRLTQDENLRASNSWLFTKYDCFDRPVYSGKYTNIYSRGRVVIQNTLDSFTTISETREAWGNFAEFDVSYTNYSFPEWSAVSYNKSMLDVQTVTYYDSYPDYEGVPEYYALPPAIFSNTGFTNKTFGLPTITQTRVIGKNYCVTTVTGYDEKARPIYQYTDNPYLLSKHITESKLDFLGKPESVVTTHKKGTQTGSVINWVNTILKDDFTYDATGRLLTHFQQVNNSGQYNLIAKHEYDKYGQLLKKSVGGIHPGGNFSAQIALQQVDYTYNIRGWLKGINSINGITSSSDDLFAFGINYNMPTHQNSTPLYNGNISETFWKYKQDNYEKVYTYSYDGLNRLKNALYNEMTINNQRYYEGPIEYDKNGNIVSMERFGLDTQDNTYKIIDQLHYYYNPLSNRLAKVDDYAGISGFKDVNNNGNVDYQYDLNGNMTSDANKGILSITYNHLNLPVLITFNGQNKNIEYTYDAAGAKLEKKVTDGSTITTTSYDSGFVYENNALKFFSHPEGYVNCENNTFTYVYQYKDHLGNVRLSYKGTYGNLTVEEKNDYYPFGLKHGMLNEVISSTNIALKYKYNGKELQDELGLNLYDYGARNYDPALGRWINIDPLAEVSRRWSPYSYCYDNPMYFVDPDGMWPWPSWKDVKSFASGAGTGAVNFVKNIGKQVKSEVKALANAYTSPTAALKFLATHHPIVVAGKAVANNITTPYKIASNVIKGDYKAAGEAYGEHVAAGLTAVATEGLAKGISGSKVTPTTTSTTGTTAVEGTVAAEGTVGAEGNAASSSANGVKLNKQLASEAQMAEEGMVIAGGESGTPLRKADALAEEFGGTSSDWVKKTSSSYTASDGTRFETHWEENITTGQRVNQKTKTETVSTSKPKE